MSIHMHIAIAWRDRADVARIDIAGKVGPGATDVNRNPTCADPIGTMSRLR
jgi:hypothetical protein